MRWLNTGPRTSVPVAIAVQMLERAAADEPDSVQIASLLGEALARAGRYAEALHVLIPAARVNASAFQKFELLAECHLAVGNAPDALSVSEAARAVGVDTARLWVRRGEALQCLGRWREASHAFRTAMARGDYQLLALYALLQPLAASGDGGAMLEYCASLSPQMRDTALVRANRAIGLSQLGRIDEANEIMDLHRGIERIPFEPQPPFEDVRTFNAALAAEIGIEADGEVSVRYLPDTLDRPALMALLAFIRDAVFSYSRRHANLVAGLPSMPDVAIQHYSCTVLRGSGSNGEHLHRDGYVSAVYHVSVPSQNAISRGGDDSGALSLGGCTLYTGGYQPCWGTRLLRPEAGWLTLFPSHFFHDVLPPGTKEPRVAVAFDLVLPWTRNPGHPARPTGASDGS